MISFLLILPVFFFFPLWISPPGLVMVVAFGNVSIFGHQHLCSRCTSGVIKEMKEMKLLTDSQTKEQKNLLHEAGHSLWNQQSHFISPRTFYFTKNVWALNRLCMGVISDVKEVGCECLFVRLQKYVCTSGSMEDQGTKIQKFCACTYLVRLWFVYMIPIFWEEEYWSTFVFCAK